VTVVESPAQIGSSMLAVFKEKTLIWPRFYSMCSTKLGDWQRNPSFPSCSLTNILWPRSRSRVCFSFAPVFNAPVHARWTTCHWKHDK
jgi:hypothetical protein